MGWLNGLEWSKLRYGSRLGLYFSVTWHCSSQLYKQNGKHRTHECIYERFRRGFALLCVLIRLALDTRGHVVPLAG